MKNILLIKNSKLYVVAILVCLSCFSCKKWIEIPAPIDKIESEVAFSDSTTIVAAIDGVYANFGYYNYTGMGGINGEYLTIYPALSSDELSASSPGSYVKQFEDNGLRPENSTVSAFWRTGYEGIYRINACIEGITKSNGVRKELKDRFIGEIKVARALYYFNLVNLYGGVPIVTTTEYAANARLPRASENEVYQLIIADLKEARNVLKATYPSAGRARPNLYTATALLAKVYLYQQNWVEAEKMAKEVSNSGVYSLVTDPDKVFLGTSSTFTNTEAIWQLPTVGGNYQQTAEAYTFAFYPIRFGVIPTYYLTQTLINAFEPNDLRKTKWLKAFTLNGNTYYYPFKYKNLDAGTTPREDYMLFRLSEQYLILAEALAHQGKLTDALVYLNQVRTRAGLPTINPETQESLLNAIMQERRIELFCERGNRWFDLKRSGTANTVLGGMKSAKWQPEDALYPVALSELNTNSTLVQNPGY
ncbi:RagB/SusD family nutrient uptake outer membrane protein [Solitalea lacus]|uniref:RagB/SusD family nutrient uptake outer membrane protein n=1 Tax=Solitalea lacus TaxID=2911172 RepID=UPI001EDA29AE|nr:RagB/SusD family nutrient uptake outer membrane protein [Solitalea lacus]UKJ06762.1 RagB/SusD family nutrient uptake outer membrane protein [Solitalea lacus]